MRTVLRIAPATLMCLLGVWPIAFALTFDKCDRACASSGEAIAARLAGGGIGLLLVAVGSLAVAHLTTQGERGALLPRFSALLLVFFVLWVAWSIALSVSVTT